MRYEEHHNTPVLVVEPDDERVVVLNWLGLYATRWQQQRGPIVVVVPQDAVFRRPGDLRELQQIVGGQHENGSMLILVIEGNERLRLWARRQGFNVYATLETCLKASMPQGGIQYGSQAESDLPVTSEWLPQQPFTGYNARHNQPDRDGGTRGETYHSATAVADSRTTSGSHLPQDPEQQQVRSAYWFVSSARRTEPLIDRYLSTIPALTRPSDPSLTLVVASTGATPAFDPLYSHQNGYTEMSPSPQAPFPVSTTFTLNAQENEPAEAGVSWLNQTPEWANRTLVNERTLGRQVKEALRKADQSVWSDKGDLHVRDLIVLDQQGIEPRWGVISLHMQRIRQDRLLLLLVALVALGILGGIGFGYLGHVMTAF